MTQLSKRSLLTPEVRGSENFYRPLFTVNCFEKTKIKKKRPGIAHLGLAKKLIKLQKTVITSHERREMSFSIDLLNWIEN